MIKAGFSFKLDNLKELKSGEYPIITEISEIGNDRSAMIGHVSVRLATASGRKRSLVW